MEQLARKYSKQMEGLEFLVHHGPPPQCLLDEPSSETDESTASSFLSEPFSDYTPLETQATLGVRGQLYKFSSHFQACVSEVQPLEQETLPTRKVSHDGRDSLLLQDKNLQSPIELEIPKEFLPAAEDEVRVVPPLRRVSISKVDEALEHDALWNMLEQYSEFQLSEIAGPRHIEQAPVPDNTRESALVKCSAWLERYESGGERPQAADSPPPTPEVQIQPQEHVRSKWRREKTLMLLACRAEPH